MGKRLTYKQQYKKEITKIKRRIRNIEKRGYNVEIERDFEIPQKVGKRELQRLQEKYSLENIYEQSSYDVIINGEYAFTLSGKSARSAERKTAAQKGYRTRKEREFEQYRKEHGYYPDEWYDFYGIRRDYNYESDYDYEYDTSDEPLPEYKTIYNNLKALLDRIDNWNEEEIEGYSSASNWYSVKLAESKRNDKDTLKRLIESLIQTSSEEYVAKKVEENADEIFAIADSIMYKTYDKNRPYDATVDLNKIAYILSGQMINNFFSNSTRVGV